MVSILPFRALRYHLGNARAELADVTAPPYDVITPEQQQTLYQKHPANVVRLILNKKEDGDTPGHNIYTRPADLIDQWRRDHWLVPEQAPAFYAYSQHWEEHQRKGLLGLLHLKGDGGEGIIPHEKTIAKYIGDRLDLAQTTGVNLSPLFMIYSDPRRNVESRVFDGAEEGWQQARDTDGVVHRIRPVTDDALLKDIQALFDDQTLLIADGHHRFQTALTLKKEARRRYREKFGEEPEDGKLLTDYVMVFLSNMDDPGLQVYPTHRLLKRWPDGWSQKRFDEALLDYFEAVNEVNFDADPQLMIYRGLKDQPRWTLKLKDKRLLEQMPEALSEMDVAVLDEVIIQRMFGDSAQNLKQNGILWFERDEAEVNRLVDDEQVAAAFMMHAPSVHQVKAICEAGRCMPQKSTYFYPKILSGLTFYPYTEQDDGQHALSGVVDDARPLPADLFEAATATRH